MATNKQVLDLISAHLEGDDKFRKCVESIVTDEKGKNEKGGYTKDLEKRLNQFTKKTNLEELPYNITMYFKSFFTEIEVNANLDDLYVSDETKAILQNVVKEYGYKEQFKPWQIESDRKLLLEGSSGCGKTFTAQCLAKELELPLFVVKTEMLVDSHLGATAKQLSQVFECIKSLPAVYLFDEFDSIGFSRISSKGESTEGEMRRVLNSLLQFIENDKSNSVIIATTNLIELIDKALHRRFDYILTYDKPTKDIIEKLYSENLKEYLQANSGAELNITDELIEVSTGISSAEIIKICKRAIKNNILNGDKIDSEKLINLCSKYKV